MKNSKAKIMSALAIAAIIIAVLTSCADNSIDNGASTASRDLTVQLPVVYSVPEDAKLMENGRGITCYSIGEELSAISESSDNIIKGKVKGYEYTYYDGEAFTAVIFSVEESYKGDLQAGDLITILHAGGYIPLQVHIDRYDDRYIFENVTDEEISATVIHEPLEGEEPVVGDEYIYFIAPVEAIEVYGEGLYAPVRDASSIFHLSADGKTAERTYDFGNFEAYPVEEVITAAVKEG